MAKSRVAAIVGIGPGNGRALAEKFASEGFQVAMLSRSGDTLNDYEREIANAHAFVCDATDHESVRTAFEAVRETLGDVDVLIYNAGAGLWGGLGDITDQDLEFCWRVNAQGLFHCAQQVIEPMTIHGNGAIAVIGAGAAWRGRAGTLAFAQAKAAQRSIAQSLARQYGTEGIHIGSVVIDGVVDTPKTRKAMPDKGDDFFLKPADIALSVFNLVAQPRSAWSFEIDLRPHTESW